MRNDIALPATASLDAELGELLAELSASGVVLRAHGERLRCEAPAGVLDANVRSRLAERKSEILAYLRGAPLDTEAIRARPEDRLRPAPLSWSQERFWVIQHWEGAAATTYNMTDAVQLRGSLDVGALERAVCDLVERHDILRTVFRTVNGSPSQVLRADLRVVLRTTDLEDEPDSQRFAEAQRRAEAERTTPFDLEQGPLVRVLLQRLSADEHILSLTMHHIIADGWSFGVFLSELSALYRSHAGGSLPRLPRVPLQYRDYAIWQRAQSDGERLARQREYWVETLRGAPSHTALPFDHPRRHSAQRRAATHSTSISGALHRELADFANSMGTTLFAAMTACLQAVLSRWSGERDVVIGTVVAGRPLPELEVMLGCFINFLPVRGSVSPEASLANVVRAAGQTLLDAYGNQDIPFEEIVRAVNPERVAGVNPIYNVGFILHNYPLRAALSEDLEIEHLPIDTQFAPLDLTLMAWDPQDDTGRLVLKCHYDAALFAADTVAALVEALVGAFRLAARAPDTAVQALPPPPTGAGQPDREGSGDAADGAGNGTVPFVDEAPARLRLQLAQLWLRVLGLRTINMEDDFWELGGTSLLAIRLMMEIGRQFGVDLPLVAITEHPTVAGLARAVHNGGRRRPQTTIVRLQPEGGLNPFFAVPGGAMDAIEFTHLARHFAPGRPFYAFQPAGLDGRHAPHTSVEEMAQCYIEALREVTPHGPYLLGGHSFGGRVAFEMAQQLLASGEEVPLLTIFDGDAPLSDSGALGAHDDAWRLRNLTRILERFFGRSVDVAPDVFQQPVDVQVRTLCERLKKAEILAADDDEQRLRDFLQVSRATSRASDTYRPARRTPLPIVLFRAQQEIEEAAAGHSITQYDGDPELGWGAFALGSVEVEVVAGDHVTIMAEPQVGGLAQRVTQRLAAGSSAAAST